MVNIEDLSDEQLARLREEFERMGRIGGTEPISDVAEIEVEDLENAENGAKAPQLNNLEDQLPPDTPSNPG